MWQVVLRQVFTPYSRLLISSAFIVVSRVGFLGVTGVAMRIRQNILSYHTKPLTLSLGFTVHWDTQHFSITLLKMEPYSLR